MDLVFFFVFYSVCMCECFCMSEALDYLSYITVFLCWHNMCVLVSWGYYFKSFHFQNAVPHCHVLYLRCMWFPLFFHIDVLCLFLSSVVLFVISVLISLIFLICAYPAYGRLSHWQLFINLCFSVFSCNITILMHLPLSALQCCLWFCLALTWLMFVFVYDISGLHSYLNLIKLISVLCGAVFGSLLCAYSLADVSLIL